MSWADYRADQKKRFDLHAVYNEKTWKKYYLTFPELAKRIRADHRNRLGLITLAEDRPRIHVNVPEVAVKKSCKPNENFKPLAENQVKWMYRHQAGTLCSLLVREANRACLEKAGL